jgi:KAP family P-loop domain
MNVIKRRFNRLIRAIGRPVAIVIDDLDRCRADYVVQLLEGIQTLLRDAPVRYVVAADRRWLYDSFTSVYEAHGKSAQEPGRPLGHLFLEKSFQLSTAVPQLDPDDTEEFLLRLMQGPSDPVELEQAAAEAEREFKVYEYEDDIRGALREEPSDPIHKQARRVAAVRRLAEADLEITTEHTIKNFAHLTEPNPRALKRLLIAYRLERALRILESHEATTLDHASDKLILWTIVRLRWPLLADYLARYPDRIASIRAEQAPPDLEDTALGALFSDPEVKKVAVGDGTAAGLDQEAIRSLGGRGDTRLPARPPSKAAS